MAKTKFSSVEGNGSAVVSAGHVSQIEFTSAHSEQADDWQLQDIVVLAFRSFLDDLPDFESDVDQGKHTGYQSD